MSLARFPAIGTPFPARRKRGDIGGRPSFNRHPGRQGGPGGINFPTRRPIRRLLPPPFDLSAYKASRFNGPL